MNKQELEKKSLEIFNENRKLQTEIQKLNNRLQLIKAMADVGFV